MTRDASPSSVQPGSSVEGPLILDAKEELLFFRASAHLQAYVEAIDVMNGEYGACWDSNGRLLSLSIESRRARILGLFPYTKEVVMVRPAEDEPAHAAELHLALLRHLEAVGLEADMPVTNDTADLLDYAIEHAGWS